MLLDLHECMPEFFQVKFGVGPRHIPPCGSWRRPSRRASASRDRVITCTEQMRAAFVARGAPGGKIEVVLNSADEAIFDAAPPPAGGAAAPDAFTLHLPRRDRAQLRARHARARRRPRARRDIPGLRVEIYGDGTYRDELPRLAARAGLDGAVRVSDGWAPLDELLAAIAAADAGVVAMRRDAFRDLTHCNKMFDFIAMRRPAIVSRTRAVEAYFGDDCFALFESGDAHDLARAIRALHDDPALGRAARRARRRGERAVPLGAAAADLPAAVERLAERGPCAA